MDDTIKVGSRRRPKPSRAVLTIPKKSNSHFVGQMTFGEETGQGQCLGFASLHEHDCALLLIYAPGVIDVEEQITSIDYLGADGNVHPRTFDFRVTKIGGGRSGIEVKDVRIGDSAIYRDDVNRVAAAAIPGTADKVFVVTRRNMDPEELRKVKLFHGCRFLQPEIDRKLSEYLESFSGKAIMRDLLKAADIGDDGFQATVRLIRNGTLCVCEGNSITLSSVVAKVKVP